MYLGVEYVFVCFGNLGWKPVEAAHGVTQS